MTSTQVEARVELDTYPASSYTTARSSRTAVDNTDLSQEVLHVTEQTPPENAYTAIPDGGFGWAIVFCGAFITFWINGLLNCWGIIQVALLNSSLSHVPTSTLSFIGSLCLSVGVACSLPALRAVSWLGTRNASLLGVFFMGLALITASFSVNQVGGLFVTIGAVGGIGNSLAYTVTNILPVQYFSGKLGVANGLIKLGGGIGGTVMAVALENLLRRVGVEWTLRIQGLMIIGTGLPVAWMMKERVSLRQTATMDLTMFRSAPFTLVFFAAATGTFTLFIPPYFLPLFAQSLGVSSSTGAALVAAFNLCNAIGRFLAGPLCDKIGPINTFLLTMLLNATSTLAIWLVARTLAPVMVFAIFNGVANGSFFTTVPVVVATIFGPGRAAVAMSTSITGWTVGYLLGTPIAGFLLQSSGSGSGSDGLDIDAYRPAILYAGGLAVLSSALVLMARIGASKQILKKV